MKKFLNKKMSVKSVLIIVAVVITVMATLGSVGMNVWATLSPDIRIVYNGVPATLVDGNGNIVYPLMYNGTTYLPVRSLSNLLGIGIRWDGGTRTVNIGGSSGGGGGGGGGGTVNPPPSTGGTISSSGGSVGVSYATQFSFSPNQSGIWEIRTSNNNGDPYLTIYDARGNIIGENDDGAGDLNSLIFVYLHAGNTYTIQAGYYANGSGSYTLNVSRLPNLSTGNTRITGATLYAFTPSRSGQWTFRTSNNTGDPWIAVLDSGGYQLGYDDDSGDGFNALLRINLNSGTTYIVYAGFYGGGSGSYTLNVS